MTFDQAMTRWRPTVVRLPYVEWNGASARPLEQLRPVIDAIRSPEPLLFVLADGQNTYDHTPNAEQLRNEFRARGAWQGFPLHAKAGRTNVAVHIRRGDVAAMRDTAHPDWESRYVPQDWFHKVLTSLAQEIREKQLLFHIYSQGSYDEFSQFASIGECQFHLGCDEYETFINMVFADILVMSPSGFSYLAGLLSEGHKIARAPWWHHLPDSQDWTLIESPSLRKSS